MTDANRDHGSHDDDAGFASTGGAESRLAADAQLAQEGDPGEATWSAKLPIGGVTGDCVCDAVWRVWCSADRRPASIQVVGDRASPLSYTEVTDEELLATTNGVQPIPGRCGSLRSVRGSADSCSPMRVRPLGRLKTVRPSTASRADMFQYAYSSRSAPVVR